MFLSLFRRYEGWVSLLLVAALLVVGFVSVRAFFAVKEPPPVIPAPVAQAQGGNPTLALYPDHGPGGTYVSVTGGDWPAATEVTILLVDAQGQTLVLAKDTTGADGSLSTGFLYPFETHWLAPGRYLVMAENTALALRATTPFQVSDSALPVTVAPTVTATVITPTATLAVIATPLPTATAPASPTPLPSPTATDTAMPTPIPTDTPLPTDTPVPAANQPPQVQAALVPVDVDDDREAGLFQLQVTATDPEGSQLQVVTILQLPLGDRERKPKLKEARKVEIKVTGKELEIKAPDPQALLDQMTTYGGIIVDAGQPIDLRAKKKGDIKLQATDAGWRLDAPAIAMTIIAIDDGGLSSSVQVQSCLDEDCSAATAAE